MADSTTKPPATIDGATLRVLPTPRINLNDIDGVRREMARVYRDMRRGKLDVADGAKLAYVLSQLGKLIELGELERRLTALENHSGGNI